MTIAHPLGSAPFPHDRNATHDLDLIAWRVLRLSTAMVHHANRIRPNPSGLKVGGQVEELFRRPGSIVRAALDVTS